MKILFQTLLLSSIVALFVACNNSSSAPESIPEPIGYTPDGKCTIEMSQSRTQEQLDSLRAFCDTIFVHIVVDVYRDTVYDDTVIMYSENYTSFIYFDRNTEKYDTLVSPTAKESGIPGACDNVPVYCVLDSSDSQKTFSCEQSSICGLSAVMRVGVSNSWCSQPGYRCVRDTVIHDAFHAIFPTISYDTTFLNYGVNAWTDYIPAINAPAFDTATFINALDTLDTQKPIFGIDTLFSGYSITVEGLPDWASNRTKCTMSESLRVCMVKIDDDLQPKILDESMTYPSPYIEKPFFLWNNLESPLEKDTLITWNLIFSYSSKHYFQEKRGILEITTLFKGI